MKQPVTTTPEEPVTEETNPPPTMVCAVWGPLDKGRYEHMDCPVIVRHPGEGIVDSPARTQPLPMICTCECHTCKRAWWAQGRPLIRDGAIVRETK